VSKIPIGAPVVLKVTKAGYEDDERTLTLTESDPSAAVIVTLKRATISVEVALHPPVGGVQIILDGKPQSGSNIDNVTAGEQHKLVAWGPGYKPQTIVFTGASGDKKHIDVTMVKSDPKDKNGDAPLVPGAAGGTGKINISARGGWCNVTIDGSGRGPTPVAGIVVSAGNHSVTCTPPDGGKTMSASVNVPADGVARFAFSIPQP
jgi:hypothetical protein